MAASKIARRAHCRFLEARIRAAPLPEDETDFGRYVAATWTKCLRFAVDLLQNSGDMPEAIDQKLLELLGRNARMSVTELAGKLKLARSTVQARIEKLERS